jgi:predicted PurR-regulated permease PerM
MSRKWWIILGAVAVGIVAAIVVGFFAVRGTSEQRAAANTYATSVCTAIGDWKQQMQDIGTSGGTSKSDLAAKADQVETATKNLVNQIKAIPLPTGSDGQTANQQLDQLLTDITNTVDATKNGIAEIKDNASAETIASVAVTISEQLKSLKNSTKSAAETLGSNAVPLSIAFQRADACKKLH